MSRFYALKPHPGRALLDQLALVGGGACRLRLHIT